MAIAYKSAGSGASTETSGAALSPTCPATVDANDILIAHVFWEGTTTAPSTPSNWELLSGPHVIETTIARHWVYGKIADGSEDGATVDFGNPSVTTQRGARVYSFSGYVAGAITQICDGFTHVSHATDPQGPTVTTPKAGALAIALIGQNDNNAQASFTGESGGDWTEAVAEYTAALTPGLALQIQTCTPTGNPGTVSGGTFNTTNDPVGVIGFYIQDDPYTDKAASDTTLSGMTDSIQSVQCSALASESLSGFSDAWRLLTDSETFSYYSRIDSAQVRLNGADADVPSVNEVSVSDSCAAQSSESNIVANSLSASDSLAAGLSDTFSGSHTLSIADQLAAQFTDTFDIVVFASVADSVAAGLSDVGELSHITIAAFDSLAVQLSATANVLQNSLIAASDALTIQVDGLADIGNAWAVTDATAVQLTDQFAGSQALSVTDSVGAGLVESNSVDAQAVASDAAAIGTEDDGRISQATISATDDLVAGILESSNIIQNALIEASDSCAAQIDDQGQIGLTFSVIDDVSAGLTDAVTGERAVSTSDALSASLEAIAFGFAQTDTTESFQAQTSELLTADITFSSIDELVAQLEDVGSRQDVDEAIQKSANDSLQLLIEDGSVTEPAGPYWGGWTGTEYAIVHADSYEMGRKENPYRTRW